ncbi:FmdB family zinc ribbon protein [Phycicoccus sp. Root101]|uniref:FmdB family zinc ribbon protein n=1 Tax=Phycicoccus sp. Root101 TaxID=1736421 RepID=UPI0007025679|nr:FmdB family zinc ribbon protein [Phycicoccus sp. Root101]KQU67596.1 FmdB family transcriptional regulator [Phycicoccus sp. Root101]
MPTYSYACTECDHRFDAVQSFSDDSLTVCPVCEGRLRKVFSAVGVVFKGGGFYRTDSRSGSSASMPAGKSDSGSNGSSDSGSSSSSGSDSGSSSGSSSSGSSSGSAAKAGASSSSSKAADGSAA